jgi:hypothetical protein
VTVRRRVVRKVVENCIFADFGRLTEEEFLLWRLSCGFMRMLLDVDGFLQLLKGTIVSL